MPLQATLTAMGLKGWGPKPSESIMVTAVRHEVVNPVNPTDGSRDKKRQHSPITITKRIDQSTPFFHDFQSKGTVIEPWELRFIHNPPKGEAQNYMTVKLTGAKVIGIRTVMPRNTDPSVAAIHEYEEISFAYSKIVWDEQKVVDTQGSGEVYQAGTASASDAKDAGLMFAPDWAEEQAHAGGVKLLAELEKLGVKYGENMYAELVAKFAELSKPPPPPPPK